MDGVVFVCLFLSVSLSSVPCLKVSRHLLISPQKKSPKPQLQHLTRLISPNISHDQRTKRVRFTSLSVWFGEQSICCWQVASKTALLALRKMFLCSRPPVGEGQTLLPFFPVHSGFFTLTPHSSVPARHTLLSYAQETFLT